MKRLFAGTLLLSGLVSLAQAPQIKSGATVYIEPMDGYETYLAAAFTKKQVPLIVVMDRTKADYVVTSTISQRSPSQPAVVVNNSNTNVSGGGNNSFNNGFGHGGYPTPGNSGSTSASISIVEVHSSQVVFAYSVGKSRNNQIQSAAEACAKHLKEFIAKPKK